MVSSYYATGALKKCFALSYSIYRLDSVGSLSIICSWLCVVSPLGVHFYDGSGDGQVDEISLTAEEPKCGDEQ